MSNLLSMIQKEIDKGNIFITQDGTFLSPEKKDALIKKDCIAFLKENNMDKLPEYTTFCEKKYTSADSIKKYIENHILQDVFTNSARGDENANS